MGRHEKRDEDDVEKGRKPRHRLAYPITTEPILVSSARELMDIDHKDRNNGSPKNPSETADEKPGRIWIHNGNPAIEVSEEELAALTLFLGIEIKDDRPSSQFLPHGKGGFDLCLTSNKFKAVSVLRLIHHANRGSINGGNNYSTLFAKHMACGCLPFTRDSRKGKVHTLAITETVVGLLEAGKPICDLYQGENKSTCGWDWTNRWIQYLDSMPSSEEANNYFAFEYNPSSGDAVSGRRGNLEVLSLSVPLIPVFGNPAFLSTINLDRRMYNQNLHSQAGILWKCNSNSKHAIPVGTWWEAVAGIAFGGLVPMATDHLVEVVEFSVGGRLTDKDGGDDMKTLIDLMKYVVDDVTEATGKELPLFRRRVNKLARGIKLGETLDFESEATGIFDKTMSDITERFGDYTTLLEALIAKVPDPDTKNADKDPFEIGRRKRDAVFASCAREIERAYRASVQRSQMEEIRIGKSLRPILSTLKEEGELSAEQCGIVARCIIQVWTAFVRRVHWDKHETGQGGRGNRRGNEKREEQFVEIEREVLWVVHSEAAEAGIVEREGDDAAVGARSPPQKQNQPLYRPLSLEQLPDIAAWE